MHSDKACDEDFSNSLAIYSQTLQRNLEVVAIHDGI